MSIKMTAKNQDISLDEKRLDIGFLGRFFGTGNNASTKIAGIVLIAIIISILIVWFSDHSFLLPYCQISVPVITLTLGYLFGKKY